MNNLVTKSESGIVYYNKDRKLQYTSYMVYLKFWPCLQNIVLVLVIYWTPNYEYIRVLPRKQIKQINT